MKKLIIVITVFMCFNMKAQYMMCCDDLYYDDLPEDIKLCLPDLGKDTLPMLNECESKYFNFCFQSVRDSLNFSEKRIAFLRGNTGTIMTTKKYFFRHTYEYFETFGMISYHCQLVIFNEEEARKTGYDAAIINWSKKNLTKKEVIKRLKKRRKSNYYQ